VDAKNNPKEIKMAKRIKVWVQEFPGQITTLDGRFEAVKFTIASGATFSGWVVRSCTSRSLFSDPISCRADAIRALEDMAGRKDL
jgi:hypothetical protein